MGEKMILQIENLTMQFGGLKAISDLTFNVKEHQIFGLIGPNGAGKTTLFNVITGNYAATSGQVDFDNQSILGVRNHRIVKRGIARTFQSIRLFSSMSVLDNVLIGFHNHLNYTLIETIFRIGRFFGQEKSAKQNAMKYLDYLGIANLANEQANALSYGQQRKVEIARALATQPKLLLLDEPAAGMNRNETDELATILRDIRSDFNLTLILIEHDMPFVNALCEEVLVLDYGQKLFQGTPKEAITHPDVIHAYLGDVTHA